jgi:hypothetical protein
MKAKKNISSSPFGPISTQGSRVKSVPRSVFRIKKIKRHQRVDIRLYPFTDLSELKAVDYD